MTLFDWLNELTFNKREWSSFSEDQRESFNSYMIHRYVSMYIGYVEIANVAQKLPLTEKEKIYNIYKTMLPKKKMFLKYVKKQNKNTYVNSREDFSFSVESNGQGMYVSKLFGQT